MSHFLLQHSCYIHPDVENVHDLDLMRKPSVDQIVVMSNHELEGCRHCLVELHHDTVDLRLVSESEEEFGFEPSRSTRIEPDSCACLSEDVELLARVSSEVPRRTTYLQCEGLVAVEIPVVELPLLDRYQVVFIAGEVLS